MRPPNEWYSFGTLDFLVTLAIFCGTFVNGEKDLCNKWKSGESAILNMGQTMYSDKSQFLIMDPELNGIQVSMSKFTNANGNGTPSLNLTDTKSFTLEKATYLPNDQDNGKNFFVYAKEMGVPSDVPISSGIGFIDRNEKNHQKKLIIASAGLKDKPGTQFVFDVEDDTRKGVVPQLEFVMSGRSSVYFLPGPSGGPVIERLLRFVRHTTNITFHYPGHRDLYSAFKVPSGHSLEGGYVNVNADGYMVAGFAFSNKDKAVYVFKPDSEDYDAKVPFEEFFVCSEENKTQGKSKRDQYIVIGFGVAVLLLVVVLVMVILVKFWKFAKKTQSSVSQTLCSKSNTGRNSNSRRKKNSSSAVTYSSGTGNNVFTKILAFSGKSVTPVSLVTTKSALTTSKSNVDNGGKARTSARTRSRR